MKVVVAITSKGKTKGINEFSTKGEAEKELREVYGWKKTGLSKTTYRGCIRNEFGCAQDATATIYSLKEWEAGVKFAY
jgi:hypothetical protein